MRELAEPDNVSASTRYSCLLFGQVVYRRWIIF